MNTPLAAFANTCRRVLQIPPSTGFHDIADVREKRGSDERANGCGSPLLESLASRGQLTNRAATISDGGAAVDGFGYQVTSLTLRGERPCDQVSPF